MSRSSDHPATLLTLVGAPSAPSRLDQAALVLIDYQAEYTEGTLPLPDAAAALAEAGRLLAAARAAGTPVFHIVHHGPAGGVLFNPDGPLVAVAPQVQPQAGEVIIVKTLPNSFARTDLHDRISATGRKELIVAGFMTHMCVSATVRAALDLGYRTTVVTGASATRDLPDPLGGFIAAATVQRVSLAALADRFAVIVNATRDVALAP